MTLQLEHGGDVPLSIMCRNLEEAEVAIAAILSHRVGAGAVANTAGIGADATAGLVDRLVLALDGAPLNPPKEIVLDMLLAAPSNTWVPYPEMVATFVAAGMEGERAAAALRDLSWQMGHILPATDLVGFAKKIEVLAERSRAGGVYRYRLTAPGRAAVKRFRST